MAYEDRNEAPGIIAAAAVLIVLTTLSVTMRLIARVGILGGFEWDDAAILAAWAFCVSLCASSIGATSFGFGRPGSEVDDSLKPSFRIAIMVCSSSFSFGVAFAKASFAILYLRILQPQTRLLEWTNKILIVFLMLQAVEEMLIVVLQCRPISAAWRNDITGECMKLAPLWWTTFVFNLTTDLILFVQPIPAMWRLQLPLAKRIGLIIMLSLGLLVCVISVIRIVFVQRISSDPTLELGEPMIWSMVEIAALILCSCLPFLRQVCTRIPWLNRALGLNSSRNNGTRYYPRPSHGTGGATLTVGGGQMTGGSRSATRGGKGQKGIELQKSRRTSHRFGSNHRHLSSGGRENSQFGTVSHAERGGVHAVGSGSPDRTGSTEEIFKGFNFSSGSGKDDEEGNVGIVVTHEIKREVEDARGERVLPGSDRTRESFYEDGEGETTSDLVDELDKPVTEPSS